MFYYVINDGRFLSSLEPREYVSDLSSAMQFASQEKAEQAAGDGDRVRGLVSHGIPVSGE